MLYKNVSTNNLVNNTLALPQHAQVFQKKRNMKIWFVINIFEKLNLCEY